MDPGGLDPALEDLGLSGDLVTGEAVVLELRPASFATRALSFSIDLVVQLAVGIGLTVVVATVAPDADARRGLPRSCSASGCGDAGRVAGDGGDRHPGALARQARLRAGAWSATTAARSASPGP